MSDPVTTFTWAVSTLDRQLSDGYVSTVHYTVSATDGTYSSSAYGSVGLERPSELIAYSDLTEELVVGWVKEALGGDEKVTEIQNALDEQVSIQRVPVTGTGVPWRYGQAHAGKLAKGKGGS